MTDNPLKARVLLTETDGPGSVTVDLEAFVSFDERLSDALNKLVDRWLPDAAPQARQNGHRLPLSSRFLRRDEVE